MRYLGIEADDALAMANRRRSRSGRWLVSVQGGRQPGHEATFAWKGESLNLWRGVPTQARLCETPRGVASHGACGDDTSYLPALPMSAQVGARWVACSAVPCDEDGGSKSWQRGRVVGSRPATWSQVLEGSGWMAAKSV